MLAPDVVVRVEDLELLVADRQLLGQAELEVRGGEIVAVVGPSGSGKTTLLQALAGIIVPDRGRIWLAGTEITGASPDERARRRLATVGFVFQFGELLPELSVEENVGLPLRLMGRGRRAAAASAQASLEAVGAAHLGEQSPLTLSGGEVQRAAVARALVAHPKVVLADEPTGSLDRSSGHVLWDLLVSTCRELSTAVIAVTHNLELAARADQVLRLSDGRLEPAAAARPALI